MPVTSSLLDIISCCKSVLKCSELSRFRTEAAIEWHIGCVRTFKVLSRKKEEKYPECSIMDTAVFTNNSAEIAKAVV